jgi:uncharacterized protein
MTEPETDNPIAEPEAPEPLTLEQARVLGCLIEKEHTTPDYYPLTLNGLVTACDQSTNRDPVVSYDERTVMEALEGLKNRQFVFQVTMSGARVQKFKHNLERKFPWLEKPELALLAVLLLRGMQTVGEMRARAERIQLFPDLPAVEATLQKLMSSEHHAPLAAYFPPGPGRKSAVYAHTLCGLPEAPNVGVPAALPVTTTRMVQNLNEEWKQKMEAELAALRAEVAELRALLT